MILPMLVVATGTCFATPPARVGHGQAANKAQHQAAIANRDKIDTVDPDDNTAGPKELAKMMVPNLTLYRATIMNETPSKSGDQIFFKYAIDVANHSIRQIAEVDVALAAFSHATNREVYRSRPVAVTKFSNLLVPYVGALEGYTTLWTFMLPTFTFPSEQWTSDVSLRPVITRVVPVKDESNLHDMGNFISFMETHTTADVERAVLKDPSLVKLHTTAGVTPCLAALTCGTPRLVRFIMAHGGDVHAKTLVGDALFFAASSGHPHNLDFALAQGAALNGIMPLLKSTPLETAVKLYANDCVSWFISHHANLNIQNSMGESPIFQAILQGNQVAFKKLVAAGANLHLHNVQGSTVIHYAASRLDFLRLALAAGMSIEDRTLGDRATPLMLAVKSQSYDCAKWLLDHGANINAKDARGRDVLEYARMSNTLHSDMFFRNAVGDLKKYGYK